MWKWIVIASLVVTFWVVSLLLGLPWWLPLILTVVVAIGVGTYLLVRHLRARKGARELERALSAQATNASETMRPDLAAELEDMTAEFHKAIGALKSSKLKGGGKQALYALPWYLMIGPPGSGKTTAIRNSGLQFPYLSSRGSGAVQGVGGTRNCDWWLTNDAVVLDTAGRWTTQDEDAEWFAFLDLLKRHRPRRPLNGIMVGVSLEDVLEAGEDGAVRLARRVRERIDEVIGRLGTTMPVYVVFTKCDLVPGFVETFGDLAASDRGQAWGFTLPYRPGEQQGTVTDRFAEQLDELVRAIDSRLLRRVSEERRTEARARVLDFPRQLEAIQRQLARFVGEVFAENVFAETPTIRGAYFTSGTQEGRPIDRLVQQMAKTLGVTGGLAIEPATDPKSYFLRDVFKGVVFPDADLAAPTTSHARKRTILRVGVGALMLLAGVGLALLALTTWSSSRDFVESTATLAAVGPELDPRDGQLDALGQRVRTLATHAEEGSPWSMGLGMYRGDALREPAREAYLEAVEDGVVEPVVESDRDALAAFADRYAGNPDARPDAEDQERQYQRLKRYLLLTTAGTGDVPALDPSLRAWLARSTVEALAYARRPAPGREERAALALHVAYHLEHRASEAMPEQDADVVARARGVLSRTAPEDLALAQVVEELEGRGYALTLQRLVGSTGGSLSADRTVRGAFTRKGWEDHVRARLERAVRRAVGEPWVLGESADQGLDAHDQRVLARLRSEYFAAYVEEWRDFLRSIRVKQPAGEVEALTLLQDLTRGEPAPLGRLLEAVAYHAQLNDPAPEPEEAGVLEQATDAAREGVEGSPAGELAAQVAPEEAEPQVDIDPNLLTSEDVVQAFEGLTRFGVAAGPEGEAGGPVGLDVYQEQLAYVRDALQTYRDDPTQTEALMARLQEARTRIEGLIEEQPVGWRPRLDAWLWPPLEGASMSSAESLAAGTARSWCGEVAVPFERSMGSRYPLSQRGADTALADFAAFYRPGGTLWSFYDEVLSDQVPREGDSFAFATRLGRDAGSVYSAALPRFLERSQAITSSFFPSGASEPEVAFDIRIKPSPDVSSIRFSVGGAELEYHNGPETWNRVVWPGEAPSAGATLEVRGAGGMQERLRQEGEWGLFRLLESAEVSGSGRSRSFEVTWTLRGRDVDVTVEIRPVRGDSPFFGRGRRPVFLGPLRAPGTDIPRNIATSNGECRIRS